MDDAALSVWLRATFPEALAGYVFGSRATGASGPDSDLDLAVLMPTYADPLKRWDRAQELAAQVGCEVDLLDFLTFNRMLLQREA